MLIYLYIRAGSQHIDYSSGAISTRLDLVTCQLADMSLLLYRFLIKAGLLHWFGSNLKSQNWFKALASRLILNNGINGPGHRSLVQTEMSSWQINELLGEIRWTPCAEEHEP